MKKKLFFLYIALHMPLIALHAQGTLSIQANHATVCPGTAVTLYAIGGTTVDWQPGGETTRYITVSPTQTTTYTLTSGAESTTYTVTVCNNVDCTPTSTFNPLLLNTGSNGLTSILGLGAADLNWQYSLTANGTYSSAIVSSSAIIPGNYSKTIWPNAQWIGPNSNLTTIRAGEYYYRVQFNLTAIEASSLVINMEFMADNRVLEVGVNGIAIPNSNTPGGTDYGFQSQNASSVTMQGNWVEGLNTITVKTYDLGGYAAFVGQLTPTVSIPVSDVICENNPVKIDRDTLWMCKGDSVQLNADQAVSYSWRPTAGLSNPFIANPKASPAQTTMYYVTGTSASNIQSTDSILVIVNNAPRVSLGSKDTTLCPDQLLVFNVSQAGSTVLWQNGSTNPIYTIANTGIYSVELTNQCGTASDTLIVLPCCDNLYIPNLITPNGDKLNDYFNIGCLGSGKWHLKVFNRWGDLVYNNTNYQNKWDGDGVSDGVYYYQLLKDSEEYKGWVQIIK